MRFGGKVHYGPRLVFGQQSIHQGAVTNVAMHKMMARILGKRLQVFQVARIGELVEVDDRLVMVGKPGVNEIAADESGASGGQDHESAVRQKLRFSL